MYTRISRVKGSLFSILVDFFFNVLCVDAIALECVCKQIYKPVYMKSVYVFVCVRVCSCISQEKEEVFSILVEFDVVRADAIDSVCE